MDFDSSGQFTLDARHGRVLADHGMEEPAQAVLLAVQGALEGGAEAVAFRLNTTRAQVLLRSRVFDPPQVSQALQRALSSWSATPGSWHRSGDIWTCVCLRQVKSSQVRREGELLQRHCHFCPVAVKLEGYIVQPHHWTYHLTSASKLLRADYHLAEWFWSPQEGQPGVAAFRTDGLSADLPRLNTEHTFWREAEPGVGRLSWQVPWRVGGQIARLRPAYGLRGSAFAVLRAETGQPSIAVPVHRGVACGRFELDWPELPGLCFVFDASSFATDLSGLKLVHSAELRDWLEAQRLRIGGWVRDRASSWVVEVKQTAATSRQTRKEIGAWLSVFAATVLSGWGAFVPLPFLALPWIIWHHGSRKQILQHWNDRLAELAATKDQSSLNAEL